MSYKALYRKYRPTTFDQIVGQDHIVTTLRNVVLENKLSHAYLFVGPHGTGKTTAAYVFAKSINCVDRHAEDKWAMCNNWDSNKAALDIIEIDAASNNGVAEVRQLIDGTRYAPTSLKYKVYIIDEVHMLSKGAFNALLKILEEPPKHVVFILATTEPDKIPATVISRTQRYNFRRIVENKIISSLKKILDSENIAYDDEALNQIANLSNGGLRDAISIADQTAAYGNNNITTEYIQKVFGILTISNQISLINLISSQKIKEVLKVSRNAFEQGADLVKLSHSMLDILRDWIIFIKTKDSSLLDAVSLDELEKLKITRDFAYDFSDILIQLSKDLKKTVLPRQIFEIALLKGSEKQKKVSISEDDDQLSSSKEIELFVTKEIDNIIKPIPKPVEIVKEEFATQLPLEPGDLEAPSSIVDEIVHGNTTPTKNKDNEIPSKVIKENIEQEKTIDNDNMFQTKEENISSLENNVKTESVISKEKENVKLQDENIRKINQDKGPDDSLRQLAGELEKTTNFNIANEIIEDEIRNNNTDLDASEESVITNDSQEETEKQIVIEKTSELDLGKLFDLSNQDELSKTVEIELYTVETIINLLIQADKTKIQNTRSAISESSLYVNNGKEQQYATLLKSAKVVSVGEKFILMSSNVKDVVYDINKCKKEETFEFFVDRVIGRQVIVFVITQKQLDVVKSKWIELSNSNSLPQPKEIVINRSKEKITKSNAEEYGEDIFGDIFNS